MAKKRTVARAAPASHKKSKTSPAREAAPSAKPIIGLAGGVGSGKTTIALQFATSGCAVIHSDRLARDARESPVIKSKVRQCFGGGVFYPNGSVDRDALGRIVFSDREAARRLEAILHPAINKMRTDLTQEALRDPETTGVVWDSPLLFEKNLQGLCDAVVFVQTPDKQRFSRVKRNRGWTREEWLDRENYQIPLDKKKEMADYIVDNSGEDGASLRRVRRVFSQILAKKAPRRPKRQSRAKQNRH